MAKFKEGDIIRISNHDDPAYKYNHLYKVTKVTDFGYEITSFQTGMTYDEETLAIIKHLMLKDGQELATVTEFIDTFYVLATTQEIVLYGRE